ncbi:hypothetical protein CR203_07360 [Salipaludibacillus neizhouensis]|uniref:Probable membrane transporter protein n=1 Tax=Salipaludibacillus neizhouensis TaxID=885475 RepID=A0A3A9KCQ8_9BACI|nr:sulfite exporter TauE/SafE family protein [Salipaludibacillus neizhouensis]RKL68291.1 hypothetical protein CR203_07360 [Salipaludibacillus neizhouensis]
MLTELFLIFIILFIGSFIQGVSGFGFGIIAMSFLPFIFTIKESTLLVVSLALITALSIVAQMYKHIQWKKIRILLVAALTGRLCGFFVLDRFGEMDFLKNLLGIFLIGVVIYLFTSKAPKDTKVTNETWLPVVLGFFGGLVGGVFAVGGPFFVFFMMLIFSKDKYAYSANLQATFVLTSLFTIGSHALNGDFTGNFLVYFFVGVVTVIIGSRIGIYCFTFVSQEDVKKIAAVFVAVAAVNLILFA